MLPKSMTAAGLLVLFGCGDRASLAPLPSDPLNACSPIFGFPKAATTAYYLVTIDGVVPPKTIALPQGAFAVRAGQLELHDAGTEYLWAFYSGSGPLGGTTVVLGQGAVPRDGGRIDLLVGNDPTQVRGIASVENNGSSARVVTEDRPALGVNNMGAHEFHLLRCP